MKRDVLLISQLSFCSLIFLHFLWKIGERNFRSGENCMVLSGTWKTSNWRTFTRPRGRIFVRRHHCKQRPTIKWTTTMHRYPRGRTRSSKSRLVWEQPGLGKEVRIFAKAKVSFADWQSSCNSRLEFQPYISVVYVFFVFFFLPICGQHNFAAIRHKPNEKSAEFNNSIRNDSRSMGNGHWAFYRNHSCE